MIGHCLLLLAGLVLLVKGGDLFVSSSIRIAELLRMPRVVIGSTLVSLATTSPELVVSLTAGLHGESGLALGNAVGSCICNLGLILGVMATIRQIEVRPRDLRLPLFCMLGFGALLLLLTLQLQLSRANGFVLLALGVGYFVFDFRRHLRPERPEVLVEARTIEREQVASYHRWLRTSPGTAALFLLGAVGVILGARLLVDGAVALAAAYGIPSILIGLSIVAIGTSLPELVTALTSSRRNVSDLAVGNVLGANIANLSLVVGVAAGCHTVTMQRATQLFNFPALLLVMSFLLFCILHGHRLRRRDGWILLGFYGIYLGVLAALALTTRSPPPIG